MHVIVVNIQACIIFCLVYIFACLCVGAHGKGKYSVAHWGIL